MAEKVFKVEGMTCKHCVNTVKRVLFALEGVSHVEVSLEEGKVYVRMEREVPFHIMKSALEEWGYRMVGEV
ncbi:MAG: cation transporter [Aquificaceae bacterium]|nr:cation transporter [Aquificaceae bacterium]